MDIDFSSINMQYLIQARELAKRDAPRAAVLLGADEACTSVLAGISPEVLARLSRVHVPLVVPRQSAWWWTRLVGALTSGRPQGLDCVLEQLEIVASK